MEDKLEEKNKLSLFEFLLKNVFFNRNYSVLLCLVVLLTSSALESLLGFKGFFSASGSILTISGLLLSIKINNIFMLDTSIESKYQAISGSFGFYTSASKEEMKKKVNDFISDEKTGICLIIIGTLIWGYGHYIPVIINDLSIFFAGKNE